MAGGGLIWLWQQEEIPATAYGPWIEEIHRRRKKEEEDRTPPKLVPPPLHDRIEIDPLINKLPESTEQDTLLLMLLLEEI